MNDEGCVESQIEKEEVLQSELQKIRYKKIPKYGVLNYISSFYILKQDK